MKRLILFHVLLQCPVVRVPMVGENDEWMRIIGIMQVINLTGTVFQEDVGSRNILGEAEQSVSERKCVWEMPNINRKRVFAPFDEGRPLD